LEDCGEWRFARSYSGIDPPYGDILPDTACCARPVTPEGRKKARERRERTLKFLFGREFNLR
jgi:hypothetical protein